ncbi:MAG: TIGR01906 family membrane protein [Solobacterium sp.]|nr:TIGR01906 family membrane protein [Solobacterium sp.]
MKMRKILSGIWGFFFLTAVLLTVIDFLCFLRPFYEYEYKRDQTASYIGMSDEDLMASTNTLLDYLQDKRDDIVIKAKVNGYEREVFDERETLHMVDVKNLYQNALKARNFMLIFSVLGIILSMMKENGNRKEILWEAFKYGLLLIVIVVVFVLVYALIDFYNFWMNFHYIFFDNDLFLLDPNVSIMINMFPEIFFKDMVLSIIGLYGLFVAILGFCIRKVAKA